MLEKQINNRTSAKLSQKKLSGKMASAKNILDRTNGFCGEYNSRTSSVTGETKKIATNKL